MFHLLAVSHVFALYENPNINIKTLFGSYFFKWAVVKKRSTYHYTELTQYNANFKLGKLMSLGFLLT
jgi:hypothetical protein